MHFKSFFLFLFIFSSVHSQTKLPKKAKEIIEEGKTLYKSEMASWYGTDVFLATYDKRENIGGYFSYTIDDTTKTIFFSKKDTPVVIGTIGFDETFNVNDAVVNLIERPFSSLEHSLFLLRKEAQKSLYENTDDFFSFYENTRPNIIPLISKKERKVYVFTGPQKSDVVIFGNDYLLTFNKKNKLIKKKKLHNNIIPIEYDSAKITMHSHLPETGKFLTATDVCTLMLYSKYAGWESHNIVSKEYLNIWDCSTNTLNLILMSTLEKIQKDQKTRNKD